MVFNTNIYYFIDQISAILIFWEVIMFNSIEALLTIENVPTYK